MYLGLLTDTKSNLDISYTYRKRGMAAAYCPDLVPESESKDIYDIKGGLFEDYIGYDGTVLLNGGIDIKISLGKQCFVDHITLLKREDSCIPRISILTEISGGLKPIGLYTNDGKDEISVDIGFSCDNLIIRLAAEYKHIVIGKLKIYGVTDIEDSVYPIPSDISFEEGTLKAICGICAKSDDEIFAAKNFTDKLNIENIKPEIDNNRGNIVFSIKDMPSDTYTIEVTRDKAIINAGSRSSLLYASERLLQLCTGDSIKCCTINDKPYMGIRGVHIALPDRKQIPYLKRLVKNLFMPLGYNTVFIQLSGAMEYKSHPEINKAWLEACRKYEDGLCPKPAHYEFVGHDVLSHEEIADICSYIRSYGMEIVPEVQTFGHTQYITMAYPELGEHETDKGDDIDLYNEDIKPEDYYIHTMCPNHPDYYKITFDIIDEVITLIKPEKYLHIGHDEIYTIGKCKRCRDIPEEDIYADEVIRLNDYVKSKGLVTMMWSDMIQETKYPTHKAIDKLPKDIICLSFTWYFHLDEDVEKPLIDKGFKLMLGNFYSSHYPRFNKRKQSDSIIGAEVSTWVLLKDDILGSKGKIYEIIYSAGMMWNKEYHEDMRLSYDALVDKTVHDLNMSLNDNIGIDSISVEFPKSSKASPYDIRADYPKACAVLSGETLDIPLGTRADKISILHATDTNADRIVWKDVISIGSYTLCYTDGTSTSFDITYAGNICEYKRRYAMPVETDLFRHEGYIATYLAPPVRGKTAEGADYTLYNYTISNPHKDKAIEKITVTHIGNTDAKILVFDIKKG